MSVVASGCERRWVLFLGAEGFGALLREVQPRVALAAVPPAPGGPSRGREGGVEERAGSDAAPQGNPR